MKNLKLLGLSLMAVVLLTGCGTKTLTCTKTEEDSGLSMNQEMVVKFKGDKVETLKVTVDSKATTDTIKENWDMFASLLESQFETKDEDGIKVTTSNDKDNHSYKVSIELDLTKASEDDLEEYGFDGIADKESKLEDVKKLAEEAGYTCK